MRKLRVAAVTVLMLGLAQQVSGLAASAQDGGVVTGPSLTLDRSTMRPGDKILVTLDGFEGTAVTISVCGNAARRGSVDCNMTASEGLGLDADGSSTVGELPVAAPALPCPCLIRASTTNFDELAVASIELIGHPVGPIIDPATPLSPLELSVSATRAPRGVVDHLRAAVGGPTAYDVRVRVRNRSTERLEHVVLAGASGRNTDDVSSLDVPAPGPLEPGQTWETVVRGELPAPVVGSFVFEVTASGAGRSVRAADHLRTMPLLLLLLVLVLVVDVIAILWRRLARRRAERPDADEDAWDDPDDDEHQAGHGERAGGREPVGVA